MGLSKALFAFWHCRVRAAGGGVSRGGVPRRRRRHVPPRRLPLLPHPSSIAASSSPSLTWPVDRPLPLPHPYLHPDCFSSHRRHPGSIQRPSSPQFLSTSQGGPPRPASPAPRVIHIVRASGTLGKGRFGRIALSLPRQRWWYISKYRLV